MIDVSVIAKLIMWEENYGEAALEVEADGEKLDLAILEVANVIMKYHKRERITTQEVWERFEELEKLSDTLKLHEFRKYLGKAFETAIATNLTIYDALYIVSSGKLVTSDVKQAEIARQRQKR